MTDAVVVGSGPNGLAAAVTLARAGLSVRVLERDHVPGGGTRTEELMRAGVRHDVCSAVHPMAVASPFFRAFELEKRIDLAVPEISYAHGLGAGRSGIAYRDLDRTGHELGRDGAAWVRLFRPLVKRIFPTVAVATGNLLRVPPHPLAAAVLGARVLEQGLPRAWEWRFREATAAAMLTGVAAHAIGPLPSLSASGSGLLLAALAHAVGWPIPIGGSRSISDALIADLEAHGGSVQTDTEVRDLAEVSARVVLLDVAPAGLLRIGGDRLPDRYRRSLQRFRYGDAAAKVDYVLSGPVPWADGALAAAPTIHLGGDRPELVAAEAAVARGRLPERPYVLLSQPSVVDPGRAPGGLSTLWAYTHVPRGDDTDPTEIVTRRIEEFAPGFRDVVVDSRGVSARQMEHHNPNYVGGDIAGGALTALQLVRRPVWSPRPWRTPLRGVYLCSSATPPGPGVTGMSGFHAASLALRDHFGLQVPDLSLDRRPVGL